MIEKYYHLYNYIIISIVTLSSLLFQVQDQDGRTALSVAVTCDNEAAAKLVTLLLDNGANPNISDRDNMTPLLIAAFEGKKCTSRYTR